MSVLGWIVTVLAAWCALSLLAAALYAYGRTRQRHRHHHCRH
ncbi:hypothetical protein ACM614_23340 [Streptomyces sp. 12297]|nr:hypothetical protein [Streptomyces sp. NBC_00239]